MYDVLYIERAVATHPRTLQVRQRFPNATVIECERYGEIFNRRSQDFRLQKLKPALLIAQKNGQRIMPTPREYGIGGAHNYYFSHILNCPYDCRYCFLQGFFSSANHVLFVNWEDFFADIASVSQSHAPDPVYFFSGYDCDSLALDGVTHFVDAALDAMSPIDNAWLELRTKSVATAALKKRSPHPRCVVAFSLLPDSLARQHDVGAPDIQSRLRAARQLGEAGWPLGLRFDPLLSCADFAVAYSALVDQVFEQLRPEWIHSVSIGALRFPKGVFDAMEKLNPSDPLWASPLSQRQDHVTYPPGLEAELRGVCTCALEKYVSVGRLFSCTPWGTNLEGR